MKIKKGFVTREIAGQTVIVGLGDASKIFGGVISINATGKFIWELMQNDISKEEIISEILKYYTGATEEQVAKDFDTFISVLSEVGIIEQ